LSASQKQIGHDKGIMMIAFLALVNCLVVAASFDTVEVWRYHAWTMPIDVIRAVVPLSLCFNSALVHFEVKILSPSRTSYLAESWTQSYKHFFSVNYATLNF